ncbi:MAG: outer membrane lipoprotein carrier protein LolA [Oligoflexales bacterium]
MKFLKKSMFLSFVTSLLCFLLSQISVASSVPVAQALQKLKLYGKKLEDKEYVNFEFQQEVYRASRKRTVKSSGRALFAKPNKFRWTFDKPGMGEWIFDGKMLFHHHAEQKKAKSYSLTSGHMHEFKRLVHMVLDTTQLLKEFELRSANEKSGLFSFFLVPYKKKNMDSLELKYDHNQSYLKEVVMILNGGNTTTLFFSKPDFKPFSVSKFDLDKRVKIIKSL